MDSIGGRKVCSFCGENIASDFKRCPYCGSLLDFEASYLDDDSLEAFDTISEDVDTDNSAYKFDKTINDSTYVADFTRSAVSSEEYVNYNDDDFAFKEALADREALNNSPYAPLQSDNFSKNAGEQKNEPEIQYANPAEPKPINVIVDKMQADNKKRPLGNGMKVFMVTLSNLVPGIGQLFGVISSIVFMNTEGDTDRKSFGTALLVSSVISFVVSMAAFAFLTLCLA